MAGLHKHIQELDIEDGKLMSEEMRQKTQTSCEAMCSI
jgi:hypothetical protein